MASGWYVYILECADRTLYTGMTNHLEKRLAAHDTGKGAKYTKGRSPLTLVYQETWPTRSEALKRERAIKTLSRLQKQRLIDTP